MCRAKSEAQIKENQSATDWLLLYNEFDNMIQRSREVPFSRIGVKKCILTVDSIKKLKLYINHSELCM